MIVPRLSAIATALALTYGGVFSTLADPVRFTAPDELVAAADVVCNGIPLEIKENGRRDRLQGVHVHLVVARVRIIGRFKGKVASEIRFLYPVSDERVMVDPPDHIALERHKRYRFYLKALRGKTSNLYTGVRDDTYDDGGEAELLTNHEPDDSPPLLQARAESLVLGYVRKIRPGFVVTKDTFEMHYGFQAGFFSRWHASLSWTSFHLPPFTISDAEVVLNTAGEIDPESFVTVGSPTPLTRDLRSFVDKTVRVTTSYPRSFQGRLERVSDTQISGTFADVNEDGPAATMIFRRRGNDYIQALANLPR